MRCLPILIGIVTRRVYDAEKVFDWASDTDELLEGLKTLKTI